MEFDLLLALGSFGTTGATIALVIMLYKAFKQMKSSVTLAQIQTEYQFRPWIGTSQRFERIEPSINDQIQFEVVVKNFGELPASAVTAKFVSDNKMVDRQTVISESASKFVLGPMLPTMEKRYWFFIDQDRWKKVLDGQESLFTGVYFEYQANSQSNGYGIISEYVPASKNFVHSDMWIDNPESNQL